MTMVKIIQKELCYALLSDTALFECELWLWLKQLVQFCGSVTMNMH